MGKAKVTLSIDDDVWHSFKLHCVKNRVIASDMVNDFMAGMTGRKPRVFKIEVKKVAKING